MPFLFYTSNMTDKFIQKLMITRTAGIMLIWCLCRSIVIFRSPFWLICWWRTKEILTPKIRHNLLYMGSYFILTIYHLFIAYMDILLNARNISPISHTPSIWPLRGTGQFCNYIIQTNGLASFIGYQQIQTSLRPHICARSELNSASPLQNGHHFSDDVFKSIFVNENFRINYHWSLFLRFQSTIRQHWFR